MTYRDIGISDERMEIRSEKAQLEKKIERLERTVTVLEEVLKGVASCDRCESCRENAKAALELLEIDREHP